MTDFESDKRQIQKEDAAAAEAAEGTASLKNDAVADQPGAGDQLEGGGRTNVSWFGQKSSTDSFGLAEKDVELGSAQASVQGGESPPNARNGPDPDALNGVTTKDFATRAVDGRDMKGDLAAAEAWDAGKGLFTSWPDKIEALLVAYLVLLHLKCGGEAALKELLRGPHFVGRRSPNRGNLFLIAVRAVAKPGDIAKMKWSSELATVLIWAFAHRVAPEDFVRRALEVTLDSCQSFAKEVRAKLKAASRGDDPAGVNTPSDVVPEPGPQDAAGLGASSSSPSSGTAEAPEPAGVDDRPHMLILSFAQGPAINVELAAAEYRALIKLRDDAASFNSLDDLMKALCGLTR